jgi:hypothetical protein
MRRPDIGSRLWAEHQSRKVLLPGDRLDVHTLDQHRLRIDEQPPPVTAYGIPPHHDPMNHLVIVGRLVIG